MKGTLTAKLLPAVLLILTCCQHLAGAVDDRESALLIRSITTKSQAYANMPASNLFAELARPGAKYVSRTESDFANRVNELAKDLLVFTLLKDLDAEPLPNMSLLKARLSKEGEALRKEIIVHFESLVLESLFDRMEANYWQRHATRPISSPLVERNYPVTLPKDEPTPTTFAGCNAYIQNEANFLTKRQVTSSDMFSIMLHASEHSIKVFDKRLGPLMARLDETTRQAVRLWLLKATVPEEQLLIDGGNPPSQKMVSRLSLNGTRVWNSLVARGEEIALKGLFSPEQAEQAKRLYWKQRGILALLDPELCSRIGLSDEQVVTIRRALQDRAIGYRKITSEQVGDKVVSLKNMNSGKINADEREQVDRKIDANYARQVVDMDRKVWSLLNEPQRKKLTEYLPQPS